MKKFLALALACTLALSLLAGCSSASSSGTDQTAGDNTSSQLEKIVITEPIRGYIWSPVYLAQALGYFTEEGLDVEFQTVSGTDASAPMFAGDAQFSLRGVEMALEVNEAGQGCKILVSTTAKYPYALMGASEAYSTIQSLKGQTIAGGLGLTSSPVAWSKACLAYGGLDPANDAVVLSNLPSGSFISAMQAGEIQAAVATNAWVAKQLADYGAVTILDGTDPETAQTILGSDTYELAMLVSTDDYVSQNPETCQKVVNAVAKALLWMKTASAPEIADALTTLFPDRQEEVLYTAQNGIDTGLINFTGYHTDSGFQAAVDLTLMSGAITSGDVTVDQIYDESFLDAAWSALGQ